MSDQDEHGHDDPEELHTEPAATPHDPRLDSGGEDHPGVLPAPFDLIALENTGPALRLMGLGLAGWSLVLPLLAYSGSSTGLATLCWGTHGLAYATLIAAVAVGSPTPHGPLPRVVGWGFALTLLVGIVGSGMQLYSLHFSGLSNESMREVAPVLHRIARAACLGLPWILWRFCQHRGLSGRAIVWLWLAMASGALAITVSLIELRWLLWGFAPLGLIAFSAARQTARDVWLDAVYRNTKFHATAKPGAIVEPLRPAGER